MLDGAAVAFTGRVRLLLARPICAWLPNTSVERVARGTRTTSANDDPACKAAYPVSKEPRMAAGGPRAGNVLKCRLMPVDQADDLYEVPLSAAERSRLKAIFPDGVCDYSKPSVGYGPPRNTWMSFDS